MRSALAISLAIVLLLWSIGTVTVDTFLTRPYRNVAERLETGQALTPDTEYFEQVARGLGGDWPLSLCVRDVVRGAVTIKLASLDAAYRENAPAKIQSALSAARATLTRALACNPTDGNFWLRLAIVNFAAADSGAAVPEQLKRSLASAPSEAWIIIPRLEFAAQMEPSGHAGNPVVETDARNLVNYASVDDLADFYVKTNNYARRALDTEIQGLNAGRIAALREAIASRR